MRIKTFFIILTCGIVFFLCLIAFKTPERPSFQSLVSETHKQIYNLKNFKNTLKNAEEKRLNADYKHLQLLGFNKNPRLYPQHIWTNTTLPVIVTTLFTGEEKMGIGFAKNTALMASNHAVLMYNVGLSSHKVEMVAAYCNSSQCHIVPFDITQFPSHIQFPFLVLLRSTPGSTPCSENFYNYFYTTLVPLVGLTTCHPIGDDQDDPIRTVKALVIQDALNKAGGILYLENKYRISSYIDPLTETKPVGCFVSSKQAVTTLTHPNMMNFFKTNVESFLFLPMVDINRLLLWNTKEVHEQIMLPWIQCVLTPECVHPVGAQSQGCRFNKKPRYRYSGCHAYDASAFNIVLGITYHFNESNYTFPMADTFFTLAKSTENMTVS